MNQNPPDNTTTPRSVDQQQACSDSWRLVLPSHIRLTATDRLLCACGTHHNIEWQTQAQDWVIRHAMCDRLSLTALANAAEKERPMPEPRPAWRDKGNGGVRHGSRKW